MNRVDTAAVLAVETVAFVSLRNMLPAAAALLALTAADALVGARWVVRLGLSPLTRPASVGRTRPCRRRRLNSWPR